MPQLTKPLKLEDDLEVNDAIANINADPATDVIIAQFRKDGASAELLRLCRARGIHLPIIFVTDPSDEFAARKLAASDCCGHIALNTLGEVALTHAIELAGLREHERDCVVGF